MSSFVLHYRLQRRLDGLAVFDQYNVLFQADPNERILAMGHGWGRGGRNFAHPNLANFTSPSVRALAWTLTRLGATDRGEEAVRRSITLLFGPVSSALTTAALFALFLWLGLPLVTVSLLTALGIAAFSPLVFGSIPDHFAMSAFVIALGYLLLLDASRRGRTRWWTWAALGVTAAGITITNVMIVAVLLAISMSRAGMEKRRVALRAAAFVAAVVVFTYGSSFVLNEVFRGRQLDAGYSARWTQVYVRKSDDALGAAVRFPAAVGNTIAPATLSTGGPSVSTHPEDRHQFVFTFEAELYSPSARGMLGLVSVALVAAGAAVSMRRRTPLTPLGVASAVIVAYNWLLHTVWGDEMFLYSQHWFVSTLVLIAAALSVFERRRRLVAVLAGIYVAAVAANNSALILEIIARLEASGA